MARRLEVGGLRFHVEDEGEGRPVILLHGWPDTARLWRHAIPALAATGHRCVAPDLRGRGRSQRPEAVADYGLSKIVGDVTGILDRLGIERADVVGHDWGAAVAWLVASLAPARVDRLVVMTVGFPGAAGTPTLESLQKSWYRILFQFPGVAEELLSRHDFKLLRLLAPRYPDVEQAAADFADPAALTAGLNWYRANLPVQSLLAESPPPLPPVKADTLAVFATGDDYLTEEAMTASRSKVEGGWRYERFEGVGHWIPLEAPERLNQLLVDFLA